MSTTKTIAALLAVLCAVWGLAAAASAQAGLSANAGPDKTIEPAASTTFDGTGSTGSIASYNWDFGDGTTGTGATATKSYTTSGTYTATLVVVGTSGSVSTDTATVTVRAADTTAPNLTHTQPSSASSGSDISVTVNVTDNVGVGTVSVYYKRSNESTYNSTTLTCTGSSTSKSCSGAIDESVTDVSDVHYYFRAQDTRSGTPNVNTYPANAPTSKLTLSLTDTTAPTITPEDLDGATAGSSLAVSVDVSDNVEVDTVTLYYRFTAGAGSFSNTTMTLDSGTTADGTYAATVSVPSNANITEYYFEASDASGRESTYPSNAPQSVSSVGVTSANAPTVSITSSSSSGTAGAAVPIEATVSAGSGRAITSVVLYHRPLGASTWSSTTMTNLSSANVYRASIPASNVTDLGARWYVEATDSSGDVRRSPSAGSASPSSVLTPPGTPSDVSVSREADGVTIDWDAPTTSATDTVARYYVYRSTDGSTYALLANVSSAATSYDDASAGDGLLYHYKVSAVDAAYTEGTKSGAETTATYAALPDMPALTLSAGDGSVDIEYDAVDGAAWYIVSISAADTNGSYTEIANTTGTSASRSGLTNGDTYHVSVTPYNDYAEAGATAYRSATPAAASSGGGSGGSGGGGGGGGSSSSSSSSSGATDTGAGDDGVANDTSADDNATGDADADADATTDDGDGATTDESDPDAATSEGEGDEADGAGSGSSTGDDADEGDAPAGDTDGGATTEGATSESPSEEPASRGRIPGPGLGLVAVALAGAALVATRRRG